MVHELSGHTCHIICVSWSPDSLHVISCSDDGTACVWDVVKGGAAVVVLEVTQEYVYRVGWSADGVHIVASFKDLENKVQTSVWRICGDE